MLSANLQKLKKKALVDLAPGLSIPIHFLSLRGFSIKEGPYKHDCHTLGMKLLHIVKYRCGLGG